MTRLTDDAIAAIRARAGAATPGTHVRQLLARKRGGGISNAEEWARSTLGICADYCQHTAEEHRDARQHIAAVFLDVKSELDAARADVPALLAHIAALDGQLADVLAERNEGRREAKHACIALADAFIPAVQRSGAHLQGLAWLVEHAVDHHQWHHDAADPTYVRGVEQERDTLAAKLAEVERRVAATAADLAEAWAKRRLYFHEREVQKREDAALADERRDIEQRTAEAIALMLRGEAKRAMAAQRPTGSDATRAGALAEAAVLVDNGAWRAP